MTTPNEVDGVNTADDIETAPNKVYGATVTGDIDTAPNEVYGLRNLNVCPQAMEHGTTSAKMSTPPPAIYEDIGDIAP